MCIYIITSMEYIQNVYADSIYKTNHCVSNSDFKFESKDPRPQGAHTEAEATRRNSNCLKKQQTFKYISKTKEAHKYTESSTINR